MHSASPSAAEPSTVADNTPSALGLFRLPWTYSDNAMTWLEPTQRCNMSCDACFIANDPTSDKELTQIRQELETMILLRRCDAMLVAGGEPLVHPQIVDIVAMVRELGVKPIIVTNGMRLDAALLSELRRAGLRGVTLHVDSHQRRPGWTGKNEAQLNELRGNFADMLYAEGGLTCAFNTTIFPDTLREVPQIVRWAVTRPDRVHVLTLICVRMAHPDDPFDYYVGADKIDFGATPYVTDLECGHLTTTDMYEQIKRVLPEFEFCAYLGGTVHPRSLKWVIGSHITSGTRSYGHLGPRSMELIQNGHHALRNRFLAFSAPRVNRSGRLALFLSLIDGSMRRTAFNFLASAVRRPQDLLRRLHIQTISVVQPVDILPTGECDTCDGCPNKTYWNGRLVSACRAEEYRKYGAPVRVVPRGDGNSARPH